jgi:hypothetical protein
MLAGQVACIITVQILLFASKYAAESKKNPPSTS